MLNQCNFIGNVGKPPEIKVMTNGKKVANFSVAVSEKWKDKTSGEVKENTEWIDLKAFEPLSNIVEKYINKGSKLHVSCKVKTESWDAPDGSGKRSKKVFVVGNLIMLDGKKEAGASSNSDSANSEYGADSGHVENEDDLPF
jgi:single-strand DNA-binding protein